MFIHVYPCFLIDTCHIATCMTSLSYDIYLFVSVIMLSGCIIFHPSRIVAITPAPNLLNGK